MSNQNKSAEKKSPPQAEKDHSEITDSESRAENEVVVVMEEGAKNESLSEDKAAPKKELSRGVKWIFALNEVKESNCARHYAFLLASTENS